MCGLSGIVSSVPLVEGDVGQLQVMHKALSKRGPDGDGLVLTPSRYAALAHRRLAILDLSDAAAQPMRSPDGQFYIVFNGEIYNYQALRADLLAQGHQFVSESDTEVILKLYQLHGADCLQQLKGMFAFVIWDEQAKCAFMARDPMGIKPLYYCEHAQKLVFASELKALLQANVSNKKLSEAGLQSYLLTGTVAEPNTMVDDVFLLQAGHYLQWQAGKLTKTRYWQLSFPEGVQTSTEESQHGVREAIQESVQRHVVSDVPVGVFLSGGIDSTLMLALGSQYQDTPMDTYSIGFAEKNWNEADVANKTAQYYGANHHQLIMTKALARQRFREFIQDIDQPTTDGFNTYTVAKFAADNGQKVVLSGVGGDELFAGYPSFQSIPKMIKWGRWAAKVPYMSALLNRSSAGKWRRLADFLNSPSVPSAYQSFRGLFSLREVTSIANHYLGREQGGALVNVTNLSDGIATHELDQISALELTRYMRNQLLRDSDVMSMAHGLELRVPMVDQTLFDSLNTIPAQYRLQQGKKLLIEAFPELPEWVINRPKQGFRFPFDEWLASDWRDLVQPDKLPQNIRMTPWYRQWSLAVLDHWIDMNLRN